MVIAVILPEKSDFIMKPVTYIFILLLAFGASVLSVQAQEAPVVMQRTPEQEAAKQTEKLQQELSLTQEQVRRVYEINLRYARARQASNTRTEAMERMKNKNADLEKVLTIDQSERLQSKRYERSNFDPNSARISTQSASQQVVKQQADYRQSPVRVPAGSQYQSTYRQGSPSIQSAPPSSTYRPQSAPQAVRRSEPSSSQPSGAGYSAPSAVRSQPQAAPAYRPQSAPARSSSEGSGRAAGTSAGNRR